MRPTWRTPGSRIAASTSTGRRRAAADCGAGAAQRGLMASSSISKRSVAFGGIVAAGAALAVGQLGRADELGLAADLHPLHALRPAGDDAVERKRRRLVALVRAVELGAVHQRAAVVDAHRVGRRRARAGAFAHRLVGEAPRRGPAVCLAPRQGLAPRRCDEQRPSADCAAAAMRASGRERMKLGHDAAIRQARSRLCRRVLDSEQDRSFAPPM